MYMWYGSSRGAETRYNREKEAGRTSLDFSASPPPSSTSAAENVAEAVEEGGKHADDCLWVNERKTRGQVSFFSEQDDRKRKGRRTETMAFRMEAMPLKTAMMPRPMAETMLASCRGEERKRSSHDAGPFNGQLRATHYGYSRPMSSLRLDSQHCRRRPFL